MDIKIDSLDVKDKWKKRFKLLSLVEADKLSRDQFSRSDKFKQLSFKEKWSINSNYWAFWGGFIYYFIKGMPDKACVILFMSVIWGMLLSIIDFFFGLSIPTSTYWILPQGFCMMYANLDVYRKALFDETMWKSWPSIFHRTNVVVLLAVGSIVLNVIMAVYMVNHEYATQAAEDSEDRVHVNCGMSNIYALQSEIDEFGKPYLCTLIP
ncbi:hypothetical protein [Vibrio algivorus]|uniref:DUF2628 domain-containing protein n=1 Tax=Vibrio algivorus TaxID=1667024 RepID=A0A557NV41_9VIBR|nr:hypothetical protein [Vibrio algivorus]TVO32291.1 hypothetical protein FOF44_17060 [Vibrio algivorus]